MKNENKTTAATTKNNDAKKTTVAKQRVPIAVDNTRVTQKVRSKPGHGLANEGTNVDYEGQH